MNQQPDKLFRDKLERHQKAAPAGAWNRINAGASKKNNGHTVRWLSIAASLLLLAAAVFMLWPDNKIDPSTLPTAQEKTSAPETSPEKKTEQPEVVQEKDEPQVPAEQDNVTPPQRRIPKQQEPKKKVIIPSEAPAKEITVANVEEEQKIIRAPKQPEEITESSREEQPVVAGATPDAQQSIKLVFSAEESEEYLDKKSLAEATSSDKKPSTLKKLLKKAEGLATNQDPFGELRQKKNEILALSFKSDKQRGQNK